MHINAQESCSVSMQPVVKSVLYKHKNVQDLSVGSSTWNLQAGLACDQYPSLFAQRTLSVLSICSRLPSGEQALGKVGPKEMKIRGNIPTFMDLPCNLHCLGSFLHICLVDSPSSSVCCRPVHTCYMKYYGKDLATEIGAPKECLKCPEPQNFRMQSGEKAMTWHLFHAYHVPTQRQPHCTKSCHLVIAGCCISRPHAPSGLKGCGSAVPSCGPAASRSPL